MKIALVIFPLQHSHGSILQTFALFSVLKRMGNEVVILERRRTSPTLVKYVRRTLKRLYLRCFAGSKCCVFFKGHYPEAVMKNLNVFIGEHLRSSVITGWDRSRMAEVAEKMKFDAYVVGSDQTWRPEYVPDIYHCFLDFVPAGQRAVRIAYAPSFGTDRWEYTSEQTARCKALLSLFSAVSVREKSGVSLCRQYFGVTPTFVLDPTLLLAVEDYVSLASAPRYPGKVLCDYILDSTLKKRQIVENIASMCNLGAVSVNAKSEMESAKSSEIAAPGIGEWLGGFVAGDFIVTDSFHAMVFAILFNKPFVTVGNEQRGLSRFQSLLSLLHLEERLITENVGADALAGIVSTPVDWDAVNRIIEVEKTKSYQFLADSLQNNR